MGEVEDALAMLRIALRRTGDYVEGSEAQADHIRDEVLPSVDALKVAVEQRFPGKLTQ